MRQAFGGQYQCSKNPKHRINLYFFDSKPESTPCPRCCDGTRAERVRVLDVSGKSGRGRKKSAAANCRTPKFAA